jgi:hypothetical protein
MDYGTDSQWKRMDQGRQNNRGIDEFGTLNVTKMEMFALIFRNDSALLSEAKICFVVHVRRSRMNMAVSELYRSQDFWDLEAYPLPSDFLTATRRTMNEMMLDKI